MTLPPRDAHVDRVVFGLRQPIASARLIWNDPELRSESLFPALLLALVCGGIAILTTWPGLSTLKRFYTVFVALAPWPSILLQRYYARLAVLVHKKLGLGDAQPVYEPIGRAIARALGQMILVAIAVAPVTLAVGWFPFLGRPVVRVVAGVWALHWILVNAFESARVLAPGQTIEDLDEIARQSTAPWFVRALKALGARVPVLGAFCNWFARLCDSLAWPWREEMELIEQHPSLTAGLAITTAGLLCTPVLNLFFRPVVLVASAQVMKALGLGHDPGFSPEPAPEPKLLPGD
jgi:uncharacterized protein involved in cysteine biosynthesis